MSERKSCIRCGRSIDDFAKTCPFCNWDQTQIPPAAEDVTPPPAYVPPEEKVWWRKKAIGVAAFVALIVLAFAIGTLIHGFEPSEVKAAQAKTDTAPAAPVKPGPRSNVTLVPVSGSDAMTTIEQPITSAPSATPGQQMNDATALPADQYAAAAARAKAQSEAEEKSKSSMIDPRSLTGSAYEPPTQRAAASTPASTSLPKPMISATNSQELDRNAPEQPESAPTPMRTSAYLQYKPLPHIAVDHDIQARLDLTVDTEGRVTDVDVSEPVPEMSRLIAAVQSWRFKPATENGVPVTSRVSVDITFRANE
jgi:TonB family protein